MNFPPLLAKSLSATLVSLTLLAFALLMLALPLYRIATPEWPDPIVEQIDPDGQVSLRESVSIHGGDGTVRSRPFNATRIEFEDGAYLLGYVVAIRAGDGPVSASPPGAIWRPEHHDCELAFKVPGRTVEWIACNRVTEFSRPNRMHLHARIRLALSRALPDMAQR